MSFNYSPKIITDGLVLCLDAANTKSYPGSGTVWSDLSRGGNNGTLTNGPTFNSANGGSIVFDSTNDMATIPYNNDFNLCSITNWTISIWIKLTDIIGSFNCLIGQWPQDGDDAWLLAHTNGIVGFIWAPFSRNNYMFQSNTPLVVGNWTNVVLVKNGSNFTLYQNTTSVGTFTNASTKSSSYRVELGRYGRSSSYIGAQYSTVVINHRALSATEVLQNYNATKSRFGL
jgi:hypothetical protein